MKQTIIAGILLAVLFLASLGNILWLKEFTHQLGNTVDDSYREIQRDRSTGTKTLREAMEHWNRYTEYTHIFLPGERIERVQDAFHDTLTAISQEDCIPEAYNRLRWEIQQIYRLERLKVENIL